METMLRTAGILLIALSVWSCNDNCTETRVRRNMTPVTISLLEVRKDLRTEAPRALEHPGKIYVRDKYLFINEVAEGLHIIDNSDPANPRSVAFVKIPGNGDMAVRGNILYADSYSDLVALDITDPKNPKEVSRVEEVFRSGQFDGGTWNYNPSIRAINAQKVTFVTETIQTNCEDNPTPNWGWGWNSVFAMADASFFRSANTSSAAPTSGGGGGDGQGGSMARFALYDKYLYTVGQNELNLFDVSTPTKPAFFSTVQLGWGIETIFPYKDKLFIGSTTGMHIYDNSNPAKPERLSIFQHGRACDPVVVHDDVAYVTIRTGTFCGGTQNQLDLVDIRDLNRPQLIKSYQMQNPHGLGIDFPTLYLCEGEHGLKVFDAKDPFNVDSHLLSHFQKMDAYDVIPLGKTLMMIGKDGLYQFDASDSKNLRQLSKIPVGSPAI
ncbi:LVIVD repeat-containing protein [Persicitalea jodogahamensis]|uniref:LVIVD repeat-containing protein n=1 Tax=Persicitalea jodogahamensis TaxID=402147 RepID=A0A8J3D0I2_9BACT|nr:hypothetical protein [Persicitalea jodogahamensis]GHB52888.1 hypothetical protein GCM10007390_01950 [Persicitalea jodogahamensis]